MPQILVASRARRRLIPTAVVAVVCALVAACASPDPVAYSGLKSSSYLAPNPQDDTGRIPFRYNTGMNWRDYDQIIVDPVAIYRGADQQFGDMSEQDKRTLADHMQRSFTAELSPRFRTVQTPAPHTLRLKLTLTGAATTTPVLGALSRFDIAGGLYNGVQSVRGGEGTMTGSVIYAVEIYDAPSDRLLDAFIAKQYPNPYNIPSSFGSLAAARTGIDKGAAALAAQLR
ncbi:DUF3313 domain-containing protein (plasmid) [Azospirillum humicireducens]|uniref:DUF3313 domain-containing protein n=1 Tax=Azospirillum humicireducens TaxID=1226968 RepID=A0A2R4VQB4_9PROT|nr:MULTISPECIES: DUF3313 domain-containing protein [Azospirillum]AWB06634.1 DUF3313 domain-containing protein [Azospirillum humicireducens]